MSDKTEPEGVPGNESDSIEDFPEDDPVKQAAADVETTMQQVAETLEMFEDCACPVCKAICEAVVDVCQHPLEGLWSRCEEIQAMEEDEAMLLYLGSLMVGCAHAQATCRELKAIGHAAHEAYGMVEMRTSIAVAKTTAKAVLGGDAQVAVGVMPPGAVPMGGTGSGDPHGPN
jgi:hypothetical protein